MGDNSSSAAALDATPPGIVAVEGLRRGESVLAQAQYRQVVAVTEFYDLCCDEDERRGINPAHSGSHAAVEVSVALGINEPVVTAWIDLGLELRYRLHGTRDAFAAGRIDLDQARVVAAMLTGVSDSKLEQLEAAILDGRSLPPSKLRARARRLIARHDPDSVAHRNKLAIADRDVWIRPAENGMAYLDGHLPAADAHTLATRLREMSIPDVCAHDPRTLPQRRADALTALVPQALRAGRYPQTAPDAYSACAVGNSAQPASPLRARGGHRSSRSWSTPRRSSDSTTFPPTSRDTGRSVRTPRVHWPPTVSSSVSTRWPPKATQVGTSSGPAPFRRLMAYP
ncbi:DUF222 domain-containing protein [Rhodococcus koreensis]|uniref:DUF222 domain-containing protein n=1 Tax=Rhodococcus koreensis TaxID=99653 RepID=UPI000932C006|nr:DUF222 domain-containing protein [Rhodococcus koreensis]